VPHCLNDRSFAHRFAAQIKEKLDAVRSGNAFNLLLRPIAAKWGRPNGVFAWDHVDVDALRLLLSGTRRLRPKAT
jgi:DNA polymerase III subunit epsilon